MHRLFVAVDPPPSLSSRLHAVRDDGLNARWIDSGNHHLTLKFIGNVESIARDAVLEALGRVVGAPSVISLSQLTVFPSWRRPSVLVMLAKPDHALVRLHQDVEKVLHEAGIQPETKPYRPHITVARLRRERPAVVRAFVRAACPPQGEAFTATKFRLYESSLLPSGAAYTCVAEYPLDAPN